MEIKIATPEISFEHAELFVCKLACTLKNVSDRIFQTAIFAEG
jgi:hypothetical protein